MDRIKQDDSLEKILLFLAHFNPYFSLLPLPRSIFLSLSLSLRGNFWMLRHFADFNKESAFASVAKWLMFLCQIVGLQAHARLMRNLSHGETGRNIHVNFPAVEIDFPCLRIFKWGTRLPVLLFVYLWKFRICVSKSFRTLWKCKNGLPHR